MGAFVYVDALFLMRLKAGLAVADGDVVLGAAGALSAGYSGARVNALLVFGIASQISGTLLVRFALNLVAADIGIGRIAAVLGRTGAEGFMLDGFTGGQLRAEGKTARVLTTSASCLRIESAGVLIRTLGIAETLVRLETSGDHVSDCSGRAATFE